MSLNFPDSPVAGTVFGAWRYDGTKWGAVSGVSGGGSAGDITAVLAGAGLSGGGTEGDVSLSLAVPVTVARGGTNATDAATARTNLGAAPLDQTVTLTGDVTASGAQNTSIATTLAPVNLASKVTGTLPIANGGTGASTAAAGPFVQKAGDTITGAVGLTLAPVSGDALIDLRKATATNYNTIYGRTAGLPRWVIIPGDATAESGSNAGSNFVVQRYNDAGATIDQPLTINRATGAVTIRGSQTNDAAGAGQVGEYVTAQLTYAARASALTGVSYNVTGVALNAGDWDVWGCVTLIPAGAVTVTNSVAGISTVSGAVPDPSLCTYAAPIAGGQIWSLPTPGYRVSLTGPTSVWIVHSTAFTGATLQQCGYIAARRVR